MLHSDHSSVPKARAQTPHFGAGSAWADQRGSVLLETAIVIPMLVAVGALLLSGLAVGMTMLALGDTARESARALARGDATESVRAQAQLMSPSAQVTIEEFTDRVVVRIEQTVDVPFLFGRSITLDREAFAARETW